MGKKKPSMIGRTLVTQGNWGAVEKGTAAEASKFALSVPTGTPGTVIGRHPSPRLKDWWIVEVMIDGKAYDIPLTTYQIEAQQPREAAET